MSSKEWGHSKTQSLSILLLDDDESLSSTIKSYLEGLGHSVDVFEHFQPALSLAEKKNFDVVLCDMYLPETTGFEIMKNFRKFGVRGVVGMSGQMVEREAINRGATHFILKPFDLDSLLSVVKAAID